MISGIDSILRLDNFASLPLVGSYQFCINLVLYSYLLLAQLNLFQPRWLIPVYFTR